MSLSAGETIHSSALLTGERAILIRGNSGTGKSRLVFNLLNAAHCGLLPFARLISDDRVKLLAKHGRLVAFAPEPIRGLIEVNGFGIRQTDYELAAVVGFVIDLAAKDGARMPEAGALLVEILGIRIPRLPIAAGFDPFPLVLAALTTAQKV
jgi:HPr kinase/phosphorylase